MSAVSAVRSLPIDRPNKLNLFNNSVLDAFIEFLCTTEFLLSLLSLLTAAYLCEHYVRFS